MPSPYFLDPFHAETEILSEEQGTGQIQEMLRGRKCVSPAPAVWVDGVEEV